MLTSHSLTGFDWPPVTSVWLSDEKFIRWPFTDPQYAKIDGVMIDLFSASAAVQVYDALSEESRAWFLALPVDRMCLVAMKMLA